jgi:PHD/YefM family antitoxin component YafN of YafNO toxin-antitoxin module
MATTTLTSRQFNQQTSRAKKISKRGPVFITDRGRRTHVLLSIEEYEKLTARKSKSILDLLADPEAAEIEFEPPRIRGKLFHPTDFS